MNYKEFVDRLPISKESKEFAMELWDGKPEKETLREALMKICSRLEKKINEIKKRGLKNGNGNGSGKN